MILLCYFVSMYTHSLQCYMSGTSLRTAFQQCPRKLIYRLIACDICILLFDDSHFKGQKSTAVIERKVLIVSLFTNASDYSNKACIYRYMCLCLTKCASLVGVVTCINEERYD